MDSPPATQAKMRGRKFASRIALLLCALSAAYGFIYLPLARSEFFRRHASAVVLPYTGKAMSAVWDHRVSLPDGDSAHIRAKGGMGGTVEVLYGEERYVVYRSQDYIYPDELRLSSDRRILFATVRGWGAGVIRTCKIYEFDLFSRRLVAKHRVSFTDTPLP
jgi:hypothetical protein